VVVFICPTPSTSAAIKPEDAAREWFIRLNELDDWYISFDGREENAGVVDRFLELYAPDAFHQVGPTEKQSGAVVFHGRDAIRKWADDFSKSFTALNYRIEYKTRKEQPLQPIYAIQFPWGGTGAAAQFEAIYTNRQDRKQFVVPGTIASASKTVTIIAPEPITTSEAYQLFVEALDSVGLTAYQSGTFMRVIESAQAKASPIPLVIELGTAVSQYIDFGSTTPPPTGISGAASNASGVGAKVREALLAAA